MSARSLQADADPDTDMTVEDAENGETTVLDSDVAMTVDAAPAETRVSDERTVTLLCGGRKTVVRQSLARESSLLASMLDVGTCDDDDGGDDDGGDDDGDDGGSSGGIPLLRVDHDTLAFVVEFLERHAEAPLPTVPALSPGISMAEVFNGWALELARRIIAPPPRTTAAGDAARDAAPDAAGEAARDATADEAKTAIAVAPTAAGRLSIPVALDKLSDAARFLGIPSLTDFTTAVTAVVVSEATTHELREIFGIANTFGEGEEEMFEQMRRESGSGSGSKTP